MVPPFHVLSIGCPIPGEAIPNFSEPSYTLEEKRLLDAMLRAVPK